MIRAVIDTNLLVSYALTKGQTLSRLVNHWKRGSFIYLASPMIIEELKEVLQRPHLRAKMIADPQPLLDVVEADTEQILGQLVLEGVCRDPKDAIFIVFRKTPTSGGESGKRFYRIIQSFKIVSSGRWARLRRQTYYGDGF